MTLQTELEQSGQWLFRHRSFLPLLVLAAAIPALIRHHFPGGRRALQECWNVLCLTVAISGQGLRFYTIGQAPHGTSGRNRREQVAESLNTHGIYSVVVRPGMDPASPPIQTQTRKRSFRKRIVLEAQDCRMCYPVPSPNTVRRYWQFSL